MDFEAIQKLARLARLSLPEEELRGLAKDIEVVVAYVSTVEKAAPATVAPDMAEKLPVRNIMRDDAKPHESGIFTDRLLSVAPKREGDYIKVKKIL